LGADSRKAGRRGSGYRAAEPVRRAGFARDFLASLIPPDSPHPAALERESPSPSRGEG